MQIFQKLSQNTLSKLKNSTTKTRSTSNNGAAVQEVNTETHRNDSVKYQSINIRRTLTEGTQK